MGELQQFQGEGSRLVIMTITLPQQLTLPFHGLFSTSLRWTGEFKVSLQGFDFNLDIDQGDTIPMSC